MKIILNKNFNINNLQYCITPSAAASTAASVATCAAASAKPGVAASPAAAAAALESEIILMICDMLCSRMGMVVASSIPCNSRTSRNSRTKPFVTGAFMSNVCHALLVKTSFSTVISDGRGCTDFDIMLALSEKKPQILYPRNMYNKLLKNVLFLGVIVGLCYQVAAQIEDDALPAAAAAGEAATPGFALAAAQVATLAAVEAAALGIGAINGTGAVTGSEIV
uniref:Uncharacterized protein n=1 Tax=Glossina pallidipes TaxID=7398 RepID=A0A1A9ZUV0_GLOPL